MAGSVLTNSHFAAAASSPWSRCPSCLRGALKVATDVAGVALRIALPLESEGADCALAAGARPAAGATPSMLLLEDAMIVDARAQVAYPLFRKFQPDFDSAGGLSIIGLRNLCSRLAMDIPEIDLDRVFFGADLDGDTLLKPAEFAQAIATVPFFTSLAQAMTAALGFRVGRDYDYFRSTFENYAGGLEGQEGGGSGGAAAPRAEDDEVCAARAAVSAPSYTATRRGWQDSVIRLLTPSAEPQAVPWLLVTIAPLRVGPRALLEWLWDRGLLPLRDLSRVEALRFMHCMPELPLYLRRHGGECGRMLLRDEAELMESIALELSLARRQHTWLQILPCDVGRFAAALPGLQRRHPAFRVCVMDVRSDEEAICRSRRMALRETGRDAPEGDCCPAGAALTALAAAADLFAEVDASGRQPVLRSVRSSRWAGADESGSWGSLAAQLTALTRAAGDSGRGAPPSQPFVLSPLRMTRRGIGGVAGVEKLEVIGGGCGKLSVDVILLGPMVGEQSVSQRLAPLLGGGRPIQMNMSILHGKPAGCTSDVFEKEKAVNVAWAHPYEGAGADFVKTLQRNSLDCSSLLACFLLRGGFVHFDKDGAANCLDIPSDRPSSLVLQFALGEPLSMPTLLALEGRWRPVVSESLRRMGAHLECWLSPGEKLQGRVFPQGGAFAYWLTDEAARDAGHCGVLFPVLV